MTPVVELDGLSVRLGRRTVLEGLTRALGGRSIGLLGPNGAGKTTLIHTLLGFHPPSAGTARILGHDIRTSMGAIRARVGYMPENDAFIAGQSAVRFVTLMAELAGLPRENALERAHEALYYVGLGEARYRTLETYSLGMRQLAKLAQAIVHGPELLFLDEPTNGLDPPARARMIRLIRQLPESAGVRVILSSHLLRDVEECCEEVLILNGGRIATSCNLEVERRSSQNLLEIETTGDDCGFLAEVKALGCDWAPGPRRSKKLVLGPDVKVNDLFGIADRHEVQIRRLSRKRDSLEEIFLKAVGEIPEGWG